MGRRAYFHGLPGSAAELEAVLPGNAGFVVPDRLSGGALPYPQRIAALAEGLRRDHPDGVRVSAFSLGAMTALHLAAEAPDLVRRLDLIAPGGPLEMGDFLPHMAGAPVFRAARAGGLALFAVSAGQGLALRLAPGAFLDSLAKDSPDADKTLFSEPSSRAALIAAWRDAVVRARGAYCEELRAYVSAWAGVLDRVKAPVTIWMGEADTWVPPAMAEALADRLGAQVRRFPGLGHYGTLRAALPEIARLG